jgi:septal ring factor EnvC (AmiA/AmiB activator)
MIRITTRRIAAAALAVGLAVSAGASFAEPAGEAERLARKSELGAIREQLRTADDGRQAIGREIEELAGERARLVQAQIEAADRARALESALVDGEQRIADLGEAETRLKGSLTARRAVLGEVLASLQRMGRQPPPALLVRPEAALESVRSAILLGAVLPELRIEAEALAGDLRELVRLRTTITTEREHAGADLVSLETERQRLAALETERKRRQGVREGDLVAEEKRIADLARQAQTLEGLIASMEREVESSRKASAAAARAAEPGRRRADMATSKDPGRLSPALPFQEAKGLLPLPVAGLKMRTFGNPDGFGGTERGVSLATRGAAQVTAPCDGWVVYAGPFRSYGQLLILNAGGGYHVLLAGMERISVELGRFVLTGEPVAVMSGAASATVAPANTGSPQPVLYVEFRKDGASIDPAPWWSDATSEKVGG